MLEIIRRTDSINQRKFGNIGEKIAQCYLLNQGYDIIETNFYTRRGEIDIIAKKDNYIIFVEVKTRSNAKYGTPAMAVNYLKRKHMKIASKIFLLLNNLNNSPVRFDVVEVFINDGKCEINHIKQIM